MPNLNYAATAETPTRLARAQGLPASLTVTIFNTVNSHPPVVSVEVGYSLHIATMHGR